MPHHRPGESFRTGLALGCAATHLEIRQVAQEQTHDWLRCDCDACVTIRVVLTAYHHPQLGIPKETYR